MRELGKFDKFYQAEQSGANGKIREDAPRLPYQTYKPLKNLEGVLYLLLYHIETSGLEKIAGSGYNRLVIASVAQRIERLTTNQKYPNL